MIKDTYRCGSSVLEDPQVRAEEFVPKIGGHNLAKRLFHNLTTSLTLLSLPMTSLNCLPFPSSKAPALNLVVKSSYAG